MSGSFLFLSCQVHQLNCEKRLLLTGKINCWVFIHDLTRVNDFLRLTSHVKFSSNKVEVAWPFICHVKYWSVVEIVTYILSTSNQMNFLMQFGINKHSQIFQRLQFALALRARVILGSFRKIYLCLFIPNCTRNHLITYTMHPVI